MVEPGYYEHYKGHKYKVLGVARHSETMEDLVVYERDGEYWVRPLGMFLEKVEHEGRLVPRFKKL